MDTPAERPAASSIEPSDPPAPGTRFPGAGGAGHATGTAHGSGRTGHGAGRTVAVITAVAAGLLALLHAADLVQGLLGLPYTVHDLWRMMGGAGASGRGFTVQAPWNLSQTAVLLGLSIVVLFGGLICLGRRRGAARVGGVFAVLAVVLPLTLPLLVLPLSQAMSGASQGAPWKSTLLLVGLPSLVSASGLVPGLVAAILLAAARSRGLRPSGLGLSVVGMALGAVFALESLAALIRHATALTGWWGVGWSGVVGVGPSVALVLSLLLAAVMTAAGIGSGLLLGSTSLLTRIGGGGAAGRCARGPGGHAGRHLGDGLLPAGLGGPDVRLLVDRADRLDPRDRGAAARGAGRPAGDHRTVHRAEARAHRRRFERPRRRDHL